MSIDKKILEYLNDESGLEELEILEDWKNQSKEHLEFLNTMGSDYSKINYKQFDKEKAWNKIDANLNKKSPFKWLAVLAFIFLSALAGLWLYNNNKTETKPLPSFANAENISEFTLEDDSQIWLNKESTLTQLTDFSNERKVELNGEAYFNVEANPDNPFIIELENVGQVNVVGTKFNILHTEDDFELTVYSGHVEFYVLDRKIDLYKKDRIVRINGSYTKVVNNDDNVLSWKNKELVFDNVHLVSAFKHIERHYNVDINYNEDINFNDCFLRTKFTNEKIEDVLSEFEKIYELQYTKNNASIKITSLNCK